MSQRAVVPLFPCPGIQLSWFKQLIHTKGVGGGRQCVSVFVCAGARGAASTAELHKNTHTHNPLSAGVRLTVQPVCIDCKDYIDWLYNQGLSC